MNSQRTVRDVGRLKSSETPHDEPRSTRYAPPVRDAIIAAYYPRVAAAPDSARSRAQAAFAAVSAIAGALVGVGLAANLSSVTSWARVSGSLAVLAWLAATLLFVRAVSAPVKPVPTATPSDPDAFVDAVMTSARAEATAIDRRQALAARVSLGATILTALTVLLIQVIPGPLEHVKARITLSRDGVDAIGRLCPSRPEAIDGTLAVASLSSGFVEIKANPGSCKAKPVELRVSARQVLGVSWSSDDQHDHSG
jgi:MFS family permease